MERLTERFSNGQAAVYGCGSNCKYDYKYCNNHLEDCPTISEIYEKLATYEDDEEQGLLLRLPCKVGTEVYEIDKLFFIDRKGCKDCIYFGNDGLGEYCDYDEDICPACTKVVARKFTLRMLKDFGKTVFLTREEAEQALKQMGE